MTFNQFEMIHATENVLHNKNLAVQLLGEKLIEYRNSDAIVVSVSRRSVLSAYHLARQLQLPLQILSCWEIKHPGYQHATIGSACGDEVILHDVDDIPADFISHQVQMIRHVIKSETKLYQKVNSPLDFKFKTIIITTDVLRNLDSIQACIVCVKKQRPLKVIVAPLVISPDLTRSVAAEADQLVFLKIESNYQALSQYENAFSESEEKVKSLLIHSRQL